MNSESSEDEYVPPSFLKTEGKKAAITSQESQLQKMSRSSKSYGIKRQAAKKAARALRAISDRINANFNPKAKKKKPTKIYPSGAKYDENGVHITSCIDLCDCLNNDCVGCFFECRKCGSHKCGTVCRIHRKYIIDQIEYDAIKVVTENPLFYC